MVKEENPQLIKNPLWGDADEAITGVPDFDEEELGDLRFAFEACDLDGGGSIEVDELHTVLQVFGAAVTRETCKNLIVYAKKTYERAPDTEAKKNIANLGASFLKFGTKAVMSAGAQTVGGVASIAKKGIDGVGSVAGVTEMTKFVPGANKLAGLGGPGEAPEPEKPAKVLGPDELDFAEFCHVMATGTLDDYFPDGGDWLDGAYHMRLTRASFSSADLDGDDELDEEEFRTVVNSLHSGYLNEEQVTQMWTECLNPDAAEFITFQGFLQGMIRVGKHPVLKDKFELFNPSILIGLVLDTPVNRKEEREIMKSYSGLERFGLAILQKEGKEVTKEQTLLLMQKVKDHTVHFITDPQRREMRSLHRMNVYQAFMCGVFSTVTTSIVENIMLDVTNSDGFMSCLPVPNITKEQDSWLQNCNANVLHGGAFHAIEVSEPSAADELCLKNNAHESGAASKALFTVCTDGLIDGTTDACLASNTSGLIDLHASCKAHLAAPTAGYPNGQSPGGKYNFDGTCCGLSQPETLALFWSVNGAALGICTVLEILGLYYYGVKNAMRIANALDLKLLPINRDRAFVASSMIRAALELGNDNSVLYGVDPLKELKGANKILFIFLVLMYKAKVAITGFLLKIALKRFLTRGAAKFALPWMAVPATAAWDGMVGHVIMFEAKLRGVGISASLELFEDILMDIDMTYETKLQVARAIGCNIVKTRDMHPSKEILLRHAVRYLGFYKSPETKDTGVVDTPNDLLKGMAELTDAQALAVIHVFTLCIMLDGRVRGRERKMFVAMCDAAGMSDLAQYNPLDRLKVLCQGYRSMEYISVDMIQEITTKQVFKLPKSFYWKESSAYCFRCLAC